jgi:hypothetical protein
LSLIKVLVTHLKHLSINNRSKLIMDVNIRKYTCILLICRSSRIKRRMIPANTLKTSHNMD